MLMASTRRCPPLRCCKPKSVNDSTFILHLVELITDVVDDSRTLATARTDFRCEGWSMQGPIQCAMD
ncbi:unnamed protein product [Calypogeia fissa]